jgi:hypothetical protein
VHSLVYSCTYASTPAKIILGCVKNLIDTATLAVAFRKHFCGIHDLEEDAHGGAKSNSKSCLQGSRWLLTATATANLKGGHMRLKKRGAAAKSLPTTPLFLGRGGWVFFFLLLRFC